ncbi:MAG TPA: methyltransferase domain-containing protein [Azospirillaceae bacterium]|nr:methyltransferase domain-containing protein [Azospirillaceae bacterium]
MSQERKVLHVGCGAPNPMKLHAHFRKPGWREVRLDIDPVVKPDIVASMTDMSVIPDGDMDALYSSHNVEHLYPHEVPVALREFRRVLKPTGFALITLPDLQEIAKLVAEDKLEDAAYQSPAGPISPLDMLYGFRPSMARGNLFMAHRTGFTAKTLGQHCVAAGFAEVRLWKGSCFDLWAQAFVTPPPKQAEQPAAAVEA